MWVAEVDVDIGCQCQARKGAAVMGLVERYRRVLEFSEFDGRLLALERAIKADSA